MLNSKLNLNAGTINIIKKDEAGDIWIVYDKGLVKLHYDDDNNIQTEIVFRSNAPITAFRDWTGAFTSGLRMKCASW